jgi:transcriptional regulator with XRE-family HTH domain
LFGTFLVDEKRRFVVIAFGELIHDLRRESGLGLRELCRQSDKDGSLTQPISIAYLSRIGNGGLHNDLSKITIDKLWSLGVALGVDPLLLFVVKAGLPVKYLDHPTRMSLFDVRDVPNMRFGEYIRGMRHALELTLAEVNALAKLDPARYGMSPGYLVQVETYADEFVKNVSGEKLWALGCLYRVDPLALFCLSRGMTSLLDSKTRNSLFGKFSL